MRVKRGFLRGIGFHLFVTGVACITLCSCSLFQSQDIMPRRLNAKIEAPPPAQPQCDLPYCSVDFDFPLKQIIRPEIFVLKEQRRLWLIQDKVLVRDYHIGLGPSPRGDKYFAGDGRTPEGQFYICSKNASSRYYKSLGINYPNPQNAENALADGMISYNDYCSIKRANDAMRLPPSNTALGGMVMIHGGGSCMDWTLGCVALQNSAMDELFSVAQIGTPVYIIP